MNNLDDGRLNLKDHKWLTLPAREFERYRLNSGDLLFNRTNSKERVGKCAVFREEGDWVFASYLIRVRVDADRVAPEFVAAFLASPSGRAQVDRDSRQIIGMANINSSELRGFLIPLPSLSKQRRFVKPVDSSREALAMARASSKHTDSMINRILLDRLDVAVRDPDGLHTFSVSTSSLRGQRLDALAHVPVLQLRKGRPSSRVAQLGEVAKINPKRAAPQDNQGLVPYVGLPECSQRRIERIEMRDATGPIGRNVAINGDILFARIEPSVFNRKYVMVRNMATHDRVLTSAEFFVLQPDANVVDSTYLHEVLLSDIIAQQIVGKTTGSSGRRRLDRIVLEALMIPLPNVQAQKNIASELQQIRRKTEKTQASAEAAWRDAMSKFELSLFPSP